jgi:putative transcriptional regulator
MDKQLFSELVESMEEAVGYVKGNKKGFRTTEIKIMEPKNITALQIKALRKKLNMSQNVFACFLNVHDKTVKGWEQGLNVPKGLALRVLQMIKNSPESFMVTAKDSGVIEITTPTLKQNKKRATG